jgi:hypothetical protein
VPVWAVIDGASRSATHTNLAGTGHTQRDLPTADLEDPDLGRQYLDRGGVLIAHARIVSPKPVGWGVTESPRLTLRHTGAGRGPGGPPWVA